jgi:A/G-specific adenine glycosylase
LVRVTLSDDDRAYLAAHRTTAQRRLLAWFDSQARDLPWRVQRTPYRVWVAEVMLQQTQVETVKGYYRRFLDAFPTVRDLADASQEDVLKLWEGLGYYRRARALHRAARRVIEDFGGDLPSDPDILRSLPGIGYYTAGAVASIAFGVLAPAVDGNVRRVMARILALPAPGRVELEDAVRVWMPDDAAGDFTEALMELGAILCTPSSPRCLLCPWHDPCRARAEGRQEAYPAPKQRKTTPHYDVTAAVTLRESDNAGGEVRVLVARRPQDGMLGGLWEFPGGKREKGETLPTCLRRELQEELDVDVTVGEQLTVVAHAYTHFRITLYAFICRLEAGEPRCLACQDFQWATPAEIAALPMAVTDRKIAGALADWLAARASGEDLGEDHGSPEERAPR